MSNCQNFLRGILGAVLIITAWSSAVSADTEQSYAIKGAGAVSCERYITAVSEKSTEYLAFSGWVDGYITSFNQYQPETFDIAPWQSTLLLTQALGRFCKKNSEMSFLKALTMMLQTLYADRLQNRSEIAEIRSNGQILLLYTDIVKRIQTNLNKYNNATIKVDGIFGSHTESELGAFQEKNDIQKTGIPDQITLQILLR